MQSWTSNSWVQNIINAWIWVSLHTKGTGRCSHSGNLAPDRSVEQKDYSLWNKLETCFWLSNSNCIQVNWCFPSSFPGSRIRLMGKWTSPHGIGSFWTSRHALLPNQATQTPAGPAAHTLQAQLPTWHEVRFGQIVTANAGQELMPKSISPSSLQTRPLQQTATSKPPPGHLLCRARHWHRTDQKCLLPWCTPTQQCFCKPPKGS